MAISDPVTLKVAVLTSWSLSPTTYKVPSSIWILFYLHNFTPNQHFAPPPIRRLLSDPHLSSSPALLPFPSPALSLQPRLAFPSSILSPAQLQVPGPSKAPPFLFRGPLFCLVPPLTPGSAELVGSPRACPSLDFILCDFLCTPSLLQGHRCCLSLGYIGLCAKPSPFIIS